MLDADVTDSVIGEGCVIKVKSLKPTLVTLDTFCCDCYSCSITPQTTNICNSNWDRTESCIFGGVKASSRLFFLMQNCKIHHSVVGLRSCISEGAIIEDTLLMGADYYEVMCALLCHVYHSLSLKCLVFLWNLLHCGLVVILSVFMFFFVQTDADRRFLAAKGSVPIGIGRNSHIKRAIIDKNARIGENVKVKFPFHITLLVSFLFDFISESTYF